MYRVSEEVCFSYGHRLLDYQGKCARLHGHNGRAVVVLEAEQLDVQGFVIDFDDLNAVLRKWLDESIDHRLLLRADDPLIPHLNAAGEDYVALEENPSAEAIARLIYERLVAADMPVVEVRLWETDTACATYRGPG